MNTVADAPAAEAAAPRRPTRATALVERLVTHHGASWVEPDTLDAFIGAGGDGVLFLAGDAVRFPEGQDVAVVLPELKSAVAPQLRIGVVPLQAEDAIAARFGSQRWPALIFVREGGYVATIAGMHDWTDFLRLTAQALAQPVTRAPGVGIPVVAGGAGGPAPAGGCH